MKDLKNYILLILLFITFFSCKKSDFLSKKPNSSITDPSTLNDFQLLLDNMIIMNLSGSLSQISSDDNDISYANYQIASIVERNAYVWNGDIYEGTNGIPDWNDLYQEVFYANVVLEGLAKSDSASSDKARFLKGWALFSRSFAFYDLTKNFCKAYDAASAGQDLGIPLRLSAAIDYLKQRSTLQAAYDQILTDLSTSASLLPAVRPDANLNRPSKIAVYALLARIYLDMRDYANAEKYADLSLSIYSKLIDYNTISQTSATPFSRTNEELICNYNQTPFYPYLTTNYSDATVRVSPSLIALYSNNDLRLKVYFGISVNNGYYKKRGYNGGGLYPFTGLANDELYLIKAECLARKGEYNLAMDKLNQLLVMRFDKAYPYKNITAKSSADALSKILIERRKELVWRGLRWHDLKRLNKEGANITLMRKVNDKSYYLPPNDPRYIFPIPNDEIALSGIEQNIR